MVLQVCAITAIIEKYKSIKKNWKKKHDKIGLLAKTKLNTTGVLTSTAFLTPWSCFSECVERIGWHERSIQKS